MEKNSQFQAINAGKIASSLAGGYEVPIHGCHFRNSDFASIDAVYGVRTPIELYFTYRNCYKSAVQQLPVRRAYDLNLKAGMKKLRDFMK
ncbi:hypothetical protein GCM10009865_43290 [Aeromicrobium ponti]|uniref:Uncharacterized protein n=1 Tax=Cytobacillus oceanisediminis TaxID=665099 RepID=A0A562JD41_9BACI|nr:hypothetical protein [Cytobacillus oceanisediminis]TWH80874.1 hypothetical protein IQ19_04619 [Cytobacillus oceanisediminis]